MTGMTIGKSIAPARFIMFVIVFVAGLGVTFATTDQWSRGILVAFDVAAAVFLLAITPLFRQGEAARMRAASQANDANRAGLLLISVITTIVVLAAVVTEKVDTKNVWAIALVLVSLVLAWLFSNTIYALHYAHMFYLKGARGKDCGGIDFPGTAEPDYWDFVYFSFTLGMTFQTSDVNITSRQIRRVVIGHCLAAFVFNLGVLAFTINSIGGG
jgi:uncharacterized membrane protein